MAMLIRTLTLVAVLLAQVHLKMGFMLEKLP